MPPPENAPTGCPPGLEYLIQIDQVLVHQQIEVLESKLYVKTHVLVSMCSLTHVSSHMT